MKKTSEVNEKAESTEALEETDVEDPAPEDPAVEESAGEDGIDYGVDAFDYEDVVDDTQSLSFSAPTAWTERRGKPIEQDGALRPRLAVSDDVEGFLTQPDLPGVIVTVYPGSDVSEAVDNFADEGLCATISDPEPAKSGPFSGQQLWGDDCDGGGGTSSRRSPTTMCS